MDETDQWILRRGRRADYHWLTATGEVYMGTLLKVCPEAVLGHYLAVTSYDSGFRRLTEKDIAAGWICEDRVVYSPRVSSVTMLSYQRDGRDAPGYDEWYVFPEPRKLNPIFDGNYFEFEPNSGKILVFVNIFAFVLHDPDPYLPEILERFWEQLLSIAPETFIADGRDCLTVVSRNGTLIDNIGDRLRSLF